MSLNCDAILTLKIKQDKRLIKILNSTSLEYISLERSFFPNSLNEDKILKEVYRERNFITVGKMIFPSTLWRNFIFPLLKEKTFYL